MKLVCGYSEWRKEGDTNICLNCEMPIYIKEPILVHGYFSPSFSFWIHGGNEGHEGYDGTLIVPNPGQWRVSLLVEIYIYCDRAIYYYFTTRLVWMVCETRAK